APASLEGDAPGGGAPYAHGAEPRPPDVSPALAGYESRPEAGGTLRRLAKLALPSGAVERPPPVVQRAVRGRAARGEDAGPALTTSGGGDSPAVSIRLSPSQAR